MNIESLNPFAKTTYLPIAEYSGTPLIAYLPVELLWKIFDILQKQGSNLNAVSHVCRYWKKESTEYAKSVVQLRWPQAFTQYPPEADNWREVMVGKRTVEENLEAGQFAYSRLVVGFEPERHSVHPLSCEKVAVVRKSDAWMEHKPLVYPRQLDVVHMAEGVSTQTYELDDVWTVESHVLYRASGNTIHRSCILLGQQLDPITGFEGTVKGLRADGLNRLFILTTTPVNRFRWVGSPENKEERYFRVLDPFVYHIYLYDLQNDQLCELMFNHRDYVPHFDTLAFNAEKVWMFLSHITEETVSLFVQWDLPHDNQEEIKVSSAWMLNWFIPLKVIVHEDVLIFKESYYRGCLVEIDAEGILGTRRMSFPYALLPGKVLVARNIFQSQIDCYDIKEKRVTQTWDLREQYLEGKRGQH